MGIDSSCHIYCFTLHIIFCYSYSIIQNDCFRLFFFFVISLGRCVVSMNFHHYAHCANVTKFCQQSPHNLHCVYSQSIPFSIPVSSNKVSVNVHVCAAIMKVHHWVELEVKDRNALSLMQLFCLSKLANVSKSRVYLYTRGIRRKKSSQIVPQNSNFTKKGFRRITQI